MGILTRSTWFRLAPGITRSTNSTGLPGPASEPLRDNHAVPRSHGSDRSLQRAAGCQMDNVRAALGPLAPGISAKHQGSANDLRRQSGSIYRARHIIRLCATSHRHRRIPRDGPGSLCKAYFVGYFRRDRLSRHCVEWHRMHLPAPEAILGSRAKPASLCDVVAAKRRKESYDNFLEEVLIGERDARRARETQMPATDVLCPGG